MEITGGTNRYLTFPDTRQTARALPKPIGWQRLGALLTGLTISACLSLAYAATPGLPFTEDFSSTALRDSALTNANWDAANSELVLAAWHRHFGTFSSSTSGGTIGSGDAYNTRMVAVGDMDGDGDLDVVSGDNLGTSLRLYLNDGSSNPFTGIVNGTAIGTDSLDVRAIAIADMDGDGDLDVVAGNYSATNRMYLNNGTATPFSGVTTGVAIGSGDTKQTRALAVGDMDGDGDIDVVSGDSGQGNRLYLNNGTSTPFSEVVNGTVIGTDTDATFFIALGDVDGDGDLDLLTVSESASTKLYLNNGGPNPFSGVTTATAIGPSGGESATTLALGDADGDGDLDVAVGRTNLRNRLYLNNGTTDPFNGVSGVDIGTDTVPTRSIAFGDVDGDGDLDVVAGNASFGSGQLNILYLNNGSTSPFSDVGSGIEIGASPDEALNTVSIALGDMDGDGDLDVVTGNQSQVNKIYLNSSSPNPFTGASLDIGTDTSSKTAVAIGDVDGDGDLDVVAGRYNATNKLYLNDGDGDPFSGAGTGTDIGTDADNTSAVALADMDGDGDLDVVVGNYGETNKLYLNNGTATPFSGVTTGSDIGSNDTENTNSIAIADINNDGSPDVVAGNNNQVNRLYLSDGDADPFSTINGGSGNGTAIGSGDTNATATIAIGDMNGDGRLDVVAGNNTQTNRLYLNDGAGDPFDGITNGTAIGSETDSTDAIALGDVNGDGKLDVVSVNYSSSQTNKLYLNNGTATPFNSVTAKSIGTDLDNNDAVALGDVDGDGDLDVVVGNYSASQYNKLYLNNGTADPFSGITTGLELGTAAEQTIDIALADMDGDGKPDVVALNDNGQVSKIYVNTDVPDPFNPVTGSAIMSDVGFSRELVLADMDGDGDLDIVTSDAHLLYLNNGGTEPFNNVSGIAYTSDAFDTDSVAVGDMNGDGHLDIVTGNDGDPNRLYLNNGTSNPFNGVIGSDITSTSATAFGVALGDMNGDGKLDVVTSDGRLYLNNGGSSFTASTYASGVIASKVALGDMDGDGDIDIVTGHYSGINPNRLYLNNGDGTYTGSDITADTHNTGALALGDMDGDGDLDLVAGNNTGQPNRLYLNNGTATPFSSVSGVSISTDAEPTNGIAVADIDQDGDLDVIVGDESPTGTIRLYLNNGSPDPFNGVTGNILANEFTTTDVFAIAVSDMDGDGRVDIVASQTGGHSRLYRRERYDTARNLAGSLEVDSSASNIPGIVLTTSATIPANTAIDYYLSNDGGTRWFQARPNRLLTFPTSGTDLRWRASLRSLSPRLTPRLDTIALSVDIDTDGDKIPDSLDLDDDNDGASDASEGTHGTNSKDAGEFPVVFSDILLKTHPAYTTSLALFDEGIATGCSSAPTGFCPNMVVPRETAALWLLKASVVAYTPPAFVQKYTDVDSGAFQAATVTDMHTDNYGYSTGCNPGNTLYCPKDGLSKGQAAQMILRAKGYTSEPACTQVVWGDVTNTVTGCGWMEELGTQGWAEGCGGGNFCPNEQLTFAGFAKIVANAFNLLP